MNIRRVLLADDHSILLDGLRKLLEPSYEVVAVAHDGRAVLEKALELRPDLVIMDISMPLLNGIEATTRIVHELPQSKVIVLTMHTDREYVRAALRAGASGYIMKQCTAEDMMGAIETVLSGGTFVSPELTGGVKIPAEGGAVPENLFGRVLTPRQREVLQLVAEGKSAKEIAHTLHISVKTVEFHKASIVSALGLRTTAELTRYALEQGIVSSVPA